MTKTNINQYVYVQCHNRDHARCSANGAGCVRVEMVEKLVVLDALDAKDALIADLLDFSEEGWAYASDYFRTKWKYEEQLAELKARATR